ncbi:MAG TPA: hypothetical protein VGD81_14730 [Opitutaceae bacterium]
MNHHRFPTSTWTSSVFRFVRSGAPVFIAALAPLAFTAAGEGQPAFRIRAENTDPLNTDTGWAAAFNEEATVAADRPFRIRFELERDRLPPGAPGIALQYRRNDDEDWLEVGAHDFPYPEAEEPRSPRLSVVSTPAYAHGEPATDLLHGSARPFGGGAGINLAAQAPAWFAQEGHHEFEWPLVIRRFADGAVTNEEGDRFEVRLADHRGKTLPGARPARVRLTVPPGHVGGTFVETPGRIGPWQARNGDLYFIMEPAESYNVFMMVKSNDGGRTWREIDAGHRPETDDLESVDGRLIDGTLHLAHQVTRSLRYHSFRTSDHPTAPDTWATRDELAATERSVAQGTSLVVRRDGSMVAFFVGSTLHYNLRSADGKWRQSAPVAPAETRILAGPQAVLAADDVVHVACYRDDGTLWHHTLLPDGTFSPPALIAEGAGVGRPHYGSILPLVHLPDTNTVAIVYRLADGFLWERRASADGRLSPPVRVSERRVVQHAVDSQQTAADVVADGDTLHVLFIDETTRSLFSTHDRGGWQPATLRVDGIEGSWVRGNLLRRADGTRACGYIYDAGSRGGSGMNRYGEFPLIE